MLRFVTGPTALTFASYLGGTGADYGTSIAATGTGVCVGGLTASGTMPRTAAALDTTYGGMSDMWVGKIGYSGGVAGMEAATFLGGSGPESDACAVVAAPDGRMIFAGGSASADFPLVNPLYATQTNGDAVVGILSADLSSLEFATFVGGSGYDAGQTVALGPDGHLYLGGFSGSADLPLLFAVDSTVEGLEGLVARIDPVGPSLVYSTLLGGSGSEVINSMKVDDDGTVYVTGQTSSVGFPTARAWDPSYNSGSSDVFVAKLAGIDTDCCVGLRGNVNDDDGEDPNVADLTYLVSYLFTGGPQPPCMAEASVDGDPLDETAVTDVTRLVSYLFLGGADFPSCP